jgi:sec-independent protein translocase protein TatC
MANWFKRRKARSLPDDPEDFRLSLVEHLEDLRGSILRSFVWITLGLIGGWFLTRPVYSFLNSAIRAQVEPVLKARGVPYREAFNTATGAFMLKFKLAMILGLILVMPLIIIELWHFVAPALKPVERKPLRIVAPISACLFALGAGLCWFVIPNAISWFATYVEEFPTVELIQEPGSMVFFCLKLLLAFGLAFQLPIIIFYLNKLGLLETDVLLKNWRKATFVVFAVAMIVTPSNDWITMLAMAIPVSVLFIGTIIVVKFASKKRMREILANEDRELGS